MVDIGAPEIASPRPTLADRIAKKAEQVGGPKVGEVARKAQALFKQASEKGLIFAGIPFNMLAKAQIESLQKGSQTGEQAAGIIDTIKNELYALLPTTLEGGIDVIGGAALGMLGGNAVSAFARGTGLSGKESALCGAAGILIARTVGMTSLLSAAAHAIL